MEETLLKLNKFMKDEGFEYKISSKTTDGNGIIVVYRNNNEYISVMTGEYIANARPTGNDCHKCGSPNEMYICKYCDSNQPVDGLCVLDCGEMVVEDKDYHFSCK